MANEMASFLGAQPHYHVSHIIDGDTGQHIVDYNRPFGPRGTVRFEAWTGTSRRDFTFGYTVDVAETINEPR